MLRAWALAAMLLSTAAPAAAQAPPGVVDRFREMDALRHAPDLVRDARHAPQWRASGDELVSWIEVGANAGTFEVISSGTGARRLVIAPDQLAESLARLLGEGAVELSSPRFSLTRDGRAVLLDHAGRTFRLQLDSGALEAADAAALETRAFVEGGALSPDGRLLASEDGDTIRVATRAGDQKVVARSSGEITWRLAERPWSPDGRRLALWQDDNARVQRIPVVDYSGVAERVERVAYARAGTPLVRSRLHMFAPDTGALLAQDLDPGEDYGWVAEWLPDSSAALVLRMSRDGKRLDLLAHSTGDAAARLLIREARPETFVAGLDFALEGWADQVVVMPDGHGLLWSSERDGWRNYYLYDRAGALQGPVTRAGYPVHRVVGFIGSGGAILAIASPDGAQPYDQRPVVFDLQTGAGTRLTDAPGMHTATLAPSGQYFVDAWSSRDMPRRREIRGVLGEPGPFVSRADAEALEALGWAPPEGFVAMAADGETRLHGVLFKPRDFDPGRRYAVIDQVYAGPFTTTVPWNFLGNRETVEARALAELGFVVAVIDNRGTPGRGKTFQDASYGRIGEIEIPDQVSALRGAAATRPWMDMERIGVVGHSWGGYFALRAMLTAPGTFQAGYAGAPGAVGEDALVNEPYMGSPIDNADGYARAANEPLASRLTGALKMMHGTSDTSAPLSTTMRMTQALVEAGKPFELLLMPGEGHAPEGSAADYYAQDIGRFFLTHLGGPR